MADKGNAPENGEENKKKSKKKEDKKLKKNGDPNAPEEEEDDDSGALSVVLVTIFIILIWLAILALLVKLDVGGFGSGVLTPVLKDVPVINRILPGYTGVSENGIGEEGAETAGYDNLEDAVARIKELENQLTDAQKNSNMQNQTIQDLQAEVARLKTFEANQVEFEKIKDEFYNEVVFNDNAPSVSEYRKYYEEIDPTNAQILYKEAVKQEAEDEQVKEYAKAYSSMKAKEAAGIFNTMTNNLTLVAKILQNMGTDARGSILGAMDADVAAQVTKIMEPESTSSSSGGKGGSSLANLSTTSGNSAN